MQYHANQNPVSTGIQALVLQLLVPRLVPVLTVRVNSPPYIYLKPIPSMNPGCLVSGDPAGSGSPGERVRFSPVSFRVSRVSARFPARNAPREVR